MIIDSEFVESVIAEANRISDQPKCRCAFSVCWSDEETCWLDYYRCGRCNGLVALTKVVEGSAVIGQGVMQ